MCVKYDQEYVQLFMKLKQLDQVTVVLVEII